MSKHHRVVDLVCTDRDQHPSRRLGRLADHRSAPLTDESGKVWACFLVTDGPAWPRSKSAGRHFVGGMLPLGPHDEGWQVHCPTCRRDPQMSTATLGKIVDALATRENGVVVDVSRLPF